LLYPHPRELEIATPELKTKGFSTIFWLYLAGVALIAAGYADFPLIAYHFGQRSLMPQPWIPVLYAVAMGVDALAALLFGRWFDKKGLVILALAALLSAFFAPLVFGGSFYATLAGMVLWGIGMGAQEFGHAGGCWRFGLARATRYGLWPAERRLWFGLVFGQYGYGYIVRCFAACAYCLFGCSSTGCRRPVSLDWKTNLTFTRFRRTCATISTDWIEWLYRHQ
jgi:hypothetical protein